MPQGLPVILVLTKVDWAKNPITGRRSVPKGVEEFVDWLENPGGQARAADRPSPTSASSSPPPATSTERARGTASVSSSRRPSRSRPKTRRMPFASHSDSTSRGSARWLARSSQPLPAAAAAAATPSLVADAAILAPIQLGMMGRIATIYDLELKTMLSAGALAQLGVQIAGQALARSFLKLIPGAGNVIERRRRGRAHSSDRRGVDAPVRTGAHGQARPRQDRRLVGRLRPGLLDVIRKMAEQRLTNR